MSSWISPRRRTAWRSSRGSAPSAWAADPLLRVVDGSLAGVVFVAPLVLGGRHDLGRLVFIAFTVVSAIAWSVRQALRREGTEPHWPARILFGLAGLLLAMQLTPLPPSWIAHLSPRIGELLPLWSGAREPGELGVWNTLSLAPQATRLALGMLVAYALLFFTVAGRIRDEHDVVRLVRWIGLSAGVMAALGLAQFVASNGKFLWIYEHPSRDASDRLSGAFANRNHFAHFLSLGVPALAAWLTLQWRSSAPGFVRGFFAVRGSWRRGTTGRSPGRKHGEAIVAGGLLAIVLATALLSCSRGGALAFAVASGVVVLCLNRVGLLGGRHTAALGAAGAVVLIAVSVAGADSVVDRLSSLTSQSFDELDQAAARRKIWQANVAAIRAGGWFGAGASSHTEVYPVYLADPPAKRYTHAESGYLQILTENGVPGGALLAVTLTLAASACFRALRRADSPTAKACSAAATAALAASAVHSLCDFVWYIPACMSVTLIFAACAVRLGELRSPLVLGACATDVPSTSGRNHFRALATRPWRTWARAVAVLLAAGFALVEFIGPAAASLHWDAYLRMSNAHRDFTHKLIALPPEKMSDTLAASRSAQESALEAMIAELQIVLSRYPQCEIAHRELANRSLQLFNLLQAQSDNPMPAAQIRDAAVASQFRSSAELREWLSRAIGPNCRWLDLALSHATQAARLSPLDGQSYARLAEVCFLRGEHFHEVDAYLAQAIRVRPYDGDLLFEIGQQWVGRGLAPLGYGCWAQAFRVAGPHRLVVGSPGTELEFAL